MAVPPVLVSAEHGYEEAFQIAHGFDPTRFCAGTCTRRRPVSPRGPARRRVHDLAPGLAHLHAVGGLVAPEKLRVDFLWLRLWEGQERTTAPGVSLRDEAIVVILAPGPL